MRIRLVFDQKFRYSSTAPIWPLPLAGNSSFG